jgi:hypothetical protein
VQTVKENTLIEHRLMLPPGNHGRVTFLAAEGQYTIAVRVLPLAPVPPVLHETSHASRSHYTARPPQADELALPHASLALPSARRRRTSPVVCDG